MDSGLYAAYTGLLARTQALDTAANNLSNINTSGFRAQRDVFRGVMAAMELENSGSNSTQLNQAINAFGILGNTTLDLSQGQITATGNPLDMALSGSGFFAIQMANGTRYTRDGSFLRSQDGTLVTRRGEAVMDQNGNKITLPTGQVNVGTDGTISVTGPDGSAIAGQIGRFELKAGQITAEGTNTFKAAEGVKPAASAATVEQGSIEGANQDAVHGSMQLLLIQRQAEMMQRALNVFHNDFDKIAAEEIGKV